jgi:signal transduction histidine kinase/DNA-binding response OmpR family regulator
MAHAIDPAFPVEPAELPEPPDALKANILVVDDDERNALAITEVLDGLGQNVIVARSGSEALKQLLRKDFAVILLDLHMPEMDGYETAALIRARQRSRHIPIVFLTAVFRDDSHLLQAYSAGAVDMVFKPVDPFILKSKVAIFVDLYQRRAEVRREAELRQRLMEENFRVRTEKLLAEQALKRSEERQEAILRSLPVCFHSRAAEPPFGGVFVTEAVERLTGFPPERFTGEPEFGLDRVHPDDRPRVVEALQAAVKTGAYSCEFRWRCADEIYRCFLDQGVMAPSVEGRPREIFGTLLDVTERRALEEQLVQAQKMETVGQLTGGIAHDFNNLLTVILGNLDLSERHIGDAGRLKRQLAAIRHASERGHALTRQLLAFSRRQHLSPEVVDVCALLTRFEALIRRAIGESITLEIVLPDAAAVCEVDPSQLESALLNLAVNARDAMPDGGWLQFSVERVDAADELKERHTEARPGPWVVISVRDRGGGMSRAVRDRAFEPFFTTKEAGRGSGLGLSQVYGFVRQSGGFVTLDSEIDCGTEISIYLPPSDKSPGAQQAVPEEHLPLHGLSESVLLVEDDASVLALGIEMLTELGYRVKVAADAEAALEVLRRGERIDLLFTDVVMPGGRNGVQLAAEARRLQPAIKVLLTSGYTGEALERHQAADPGLLPLIQKPFRQAELAAKLREVLDAPAAQPAPQAPRMRTRWRGKR